MSLRLAHITLREIRMPLREPFEISSGRTVSRRILLLELRDTDGTTAWSECVAGEQPTYSSETVDTAWHAITAWIAPRVLAAGISHPRTVDGMLRRAIRGHPMAKAAVEMGIWTLLAERDGISLSRLLGGTRTAIATGISIGIQDAPAILADKAAAALAQGYRRIKMKIRPGADIAFLARRAGSAWPRGPADGRRQQRLHAGARRAPGRPGRLPPADAGAAAGPGRSAPPRAAPGPPVHAHLPRRVDPARCRRRGHAGPAGRPHREHQGGPRGRLHPGPRYPRPLSPQRRARVVRRDAGKRHRPRLERGAGLAPQLHAARRRQPQRPLLGARHRHARVDHGPGGLGRRPHRTSRPRRNRGHRPRGRPDGCGRRRSPPADHAPARAGTRLASSLRMVCLADPAQGDPSCPYYSHCS